MGKRARQRRQATEVIAVEGAVGPRQPCPCGSGRRYKACHGSDEPVAPFVSRTFEGLPGECDWVALREIVPAATAPLRLRDGAGSDRDVLVCSSLPMAFPALVRTDASVWLGLQVQHNFGDTSRDLAATLVAALAAEPGSQVPAVDSPGPGPRLQDLVDPESAFDVTVHDGFDFWVADIDDPDGQLAASLQAANESAAPTVRLPEVGAVYWTQMGGKEFCRWVLPHDEDAVWDGLGRLHAAGSDTLIADSRLIGAFRAHGLLVPVWEVPFGTGADVLAAPAAALRDRIDEAVADTAELTAEQRSARNGLANRQVTIR